MYKNLPLVSFEYPDSQTDNLRRRYVRVKSMGTTYVEGYEFDTAHPAVNNTGNFKRYLIARIPTNGVALLEFSVNG